MFECYFRKPGVIIEFIDQEMNRSDLKGIIDPIVKDLDKLTYLTVLHRIWRENTNSSLDFRIEDSSNYWRANKYMIDYASSVFNLKEYIEHYSDKGKSSSIYAPVKEAYERDQSWIKLLCEFRNYLTHHASL